MDLKDLILKLGVSPEALAQYEKGEADAAAIASGAVDKMEEAIRERISDGVIVDKKKELFSAAYSQIEKAVLKAGGDLLDFDKYKDLEKGRVKAMIGDIRSALDAKVKAAEDASSAGNLEALSDYRDRLGVANKMIEEMKNNHNAALSEKDQIFNKYKADQAITARLSGLLGGVENARLDTDTMRDIFEAETRRRGLSFSLGDGGSIVAIGSDGKPIRNPEKPSENLSLGSVFSEVASSRKFVKESNGREETRRRVITPAEGGSSGNLHPNFLRAYGDKK